MAVLFFEGFETNGNGTRYFTTDVNDVGISEFTDGSGDFFTRTDGTNIAATYDPSGFTGSNYFAAMDVDGAPGTTSIVRITFAAIDITGFENLSFSGLFAEDDSTDGNQDWDADSSLRIEYNIDGSGWQNLLWFEATATNTEPRQDTNFDGVGDGTALTNVFQSFTAAIAGTGSSLVIRMTARGLTSGDEDVAFDDIQVTGDAVNAAPVSANLEAAVLSYDELEGPQAITAALTLSDADDTDLEGATIAITGGFDTNNDALNFVDQNGISGTYVAATGILTLTGTSSVANYQAAIRSITYGNEFNTESTATRTISITVNDGDTDSAAVTRDVDFVIDNTPAGTAGDDVIAAGFGDDVVNAGAGNDLVYVGEGTNTANGDAGMDTLIGQTGIDTLNGGADNDTIYGFGNNDILNGDDGDDFISGGSGSDTIDGGAGDDTISGGAGVDSLNGGAGNDRIYTGGDGDSANGGDDNDTLIGGAGIDNLSGGAGNDALYGYGGDDVLYGDEGDDLLDGGAGDDHMYGDDGADILSGGAGEDDLYGSEGNDRLYGGADNDTLFGGEGDDVLVAGAGNDDLRGGDGVDYLYGNAGGTNYFDGGVGDDHYFGGADDDNFYFDLADGTATNRVSFFDTSDMVSLWGFGFVSVGQASLSFTQSGSNVLFENSGVTVVFYNATLADVQAAIIVEPVPLGSGPSDKSVIAEDHAGTQADLIAEFLGASSEAAPFEYVNAYGVMAISDDGDVPDWDMAVLA